MSASSLHRRIDAIGTEAGALAVAAALFDYRHRTAWGYHADRWFHAASTIKVPVLLGVFDAVARGRVSLDSRVHVRNHFRSAAGGGPYRIEAGRDSNAAVHAAVGRTLKVGELARHMIVTSSNLATNLLVDLVGIDEIRGTLEGYGMRGVDLVRGVEDLAAWEEGINNRVTAEGLLGTLRRLQEPDRIDPDMARAMLDILHDQEFRSGIPAGLPDEARVAHKTGETSTVAHDAGIVFLPDREPYVVAILTEWEEDSGPRRETIARISELFHRHVSDEEEET